MESPQQGFGLPMLYSVPLSSHKLKRFLMHIIIYIFNQFSDAKNAKQSANSRQSLSKNAFF